MPDIEGQKYRLQAWKKKYMCKDSNVGWIFSNDVCNSEIAKCPFGLSRQVGVSTVSYVHINVGSIPTW